MMTAIFELLDGEAGGWEGCLLLAAWLSRKGRYANSERSQNK
jgi:hypothetical protein